MHSNLAEDNVKPVATLETKKTQPKPRLSWFSNYSITKLLNYQFLSDSHFGSDALGDKGFNHVAFLHVVIVLDVDTALHAVTHFAGIILEPLERPDLALVNLDTIAHEPDFRITFDGAIQHGTARHGADLRHAEGVTHFGAALVSFLDEGFKQAGHGFLDLILEFVNDRVQADINFLLLRQLLRFAFRTHIEPDNDRVGSRSQQHVVLSNCANSTPQDLDLYLFIG